MHLFGCQVICNRKQTSTCHLLRSIMYAVYPVKKLPHTSITVNPQTITRIYAPVNCMPYYPTYGIGWEIVGD